MKNTIQKEYIAPWEKAFDRVLSPLEEFIHRQTTSGMLLMLCAVSALYLANSQWNEAYHHFLQIKLTIGVEGSQLSKTIHHWVNDGLMALFFFVVGLELKREILVGELADPKQALFPIIGAIGGMVAAGIIAMTLLYLGSALLVLDRFARVSTNWFGPAVAALVVSIAGKKYFTAWPHSWQIL